MMWDVLIVGGGPGGMQCAIAAASEGLKVLVLEKARVGGQIGQTPRLENSIWARQGGLTGPEIAHNMREQAERMGVKVEQDDARGIRPGKSIHHVLVGMFDEPEEYKARTVVLAMGNKWNDLNIPGMKAGIAAGTIKAGPVDCLNIAAAGREVAVFGGGPSAGQAIVELARTADRVHVILRSTLKMPAYLANRISGLSNVTLYEHARIESLDSSTLGVGINLADGHEIHARYLFACNGLTPATEWLKGTPGLKLDSSGRIITKAPSLETDVPQVYAIGDCRSGSTPRVGVAVGDGSMVVTEIWAYFAQNPVCHDCKSILGLSHRRTA